MQKKHRNALIAIVAVALLIGGLYFAFTAAPSSKSIISVSDVKLDAGGNAILLTLTADGAEDIHFSKQSTLHTDKGDQLVVGNDVLVKTIPEKVEFIARFNPGQFLSSEPGGQLGYCIGSVNCFAGVKRGNIPLVPHTFQGGKVTVTYRVEVYNNSILMEQPTHITFDSPVDSSGNVLGFNTRDFQLASGSISLRNIAIVSNGLQAPNLADVIVWSDNANPQQAYPAASRSAIFGDGSKFNAYKHFICHANNFTSDQEQTFCEYEARSKASQSNPFDNQQPGGYQNTFVGTPAYTAAGGVWQLRPQYQVVLTLAVNTKDFNIAAVHPNVAKPVIVSQRATDNGAIATGNFAAACIMVRNDGDSGTVFFSATNDRFGLGQTDTDQFDIPKGAQHEFCASVAAAEAGKGSGKLTACSSNQFGASACTSVDYTITATDPDKGGKGGTALPQPEGGTFDCRNFGKDYSYTPGYTLNHGCKKQSSLNISPIAIIALVALVLALLWLILTRKNKGGRKR